jgi:Histidine phosphatase superfamily (branch 1)
MRQFRQQGFSHAIGRREFLAAAGAILSARLPIFAAEKPKQILIIRHGEKNDNKSDIHLNARGYARAAALPTLFPSRFDTPEFLFASRQSAHSNREVETIAPLARALRLKIDYTFANEDYADLARHVLGKPVYAGQTVLICWHHGNIPALAGALGIEDAPAPWPDMQFDRVWRITFTDGVPALTVLPQRLLQGDS